MSTVTPLQTDQDMCKYGVGTTASDDCWMSELQLNPNMVLLRVDGIAAVRANLQDREEAVQAI